MDDKDVHTGIRAMLKHDWYLEEWCQLGVEADNLCQWFGNELAAVELALRTPGSTFLNKYVIVTNFSLRLGILPYPPASP